MLIRVECLFSILLALIITLAATSVEIHENSEDILLYPEEIDDESNIFIATNYSSGPYIKNIHNTGPFHDNQSIKSSSGTIKNLIDYLGGKSIAELGLDKLNVITDQYQRPYFSGHHITSNNDVRAGEIIFAMPLEDSFSVTNADKAIIGGIEYIARQLGNSGLLNIEVPFEYEVSAEKEEMRKTLLAPFMKAEENSDHREFGLLYYTIISLVSEKLRVEGEIQPLGNSSNNSVTSKWSHLIQSLSPIEKVKENHGLFLTPKEVSSCLPPSMKQVLSSMEDDMTRIVDITATLCLTPMTIDTSLKNAKKKSNKIKIMSRLTMKEKAAFATRRLLCSVKKEELMWAYAIIRGRSHKISGTPILFPIIDTIPYAGMAILRPGKIRDVILSNSTSPYHTNKSRVSIAEFVTTKNIRRGELLTFRTDTRDPFEVMLSLGYFDSNFYFNDSDGIPLEMIFSLMFKTETEEEVNREMEASPRFGTLKCTTNPKSWSIPFHYRVLNETDPFDAFHPEMIRCIQMAVIKNVTRLTGAELADFREKYPELYYSTEEHVESSLYKTPEAENRTTTETLKSKTRNELAAWVNGVRRETIDILRYSLGVSKQMFEYHHHRCLSSKHHREFLKEIASFHIMAGWIMNRALDHLEISTNSDSDQDDSNNTHHNSVNRTVDVVIEGDL